MNKFKQSFVIRVFIVLNLLLITVPFAISWYSYYLDNMYIEAFYRKGSWVVIALFTVVYFSYSRIYDGFKVAISRISEIFYSQVLALIITNVIEYMILWLLIRYIPNPVPLILSLIVQIAVSFFWSIAAHKFYFKINSPAKTAVVYTEQRSMEELVGEYGLEKRFNVCYTLTDEVCIQRNMADLEGMDVVLLCGVNSHQRNIILKYCISNGIEMYSVPRVGDVIMSGARQMHMFHLPILMTGRYSPSLEFLAIKRAMDIIISLVALIISSPFFVVTMIVVKLEDNGPIFYRQTRLTKDGKTFELIKFRSMRVDAEKDGVARLSTGDNDDRITKVGRFIRKMRIDELPQLINILKGEMSIVGPRPERPEIAKEYEETLPEFALRLQTKAGLTGYAQVYGKYNTIPYDKLLMDLMYIAKPSILEDLKIIFATIKILFIPESTQGIDKDKTNAM